MKLIIIFLMDESWMCLTWKLSSSSVTFKMRERIAVFSIFIKRKELMCLFVSFCFDINIYKTFFIYFLTPSSLKSSLTLAQQIFLAWFLLNHVFFSFLEKEVIPHIVTRVQVIGTPESWWWAPWRLSGSLENPHICSMLHVVFLLWDLWFYFLPYCHLI